MRAIFTLACALAAVFPVIAQAPRTAARKAPPPRAGAPKSTFDKAAFESYLRHLELWAPQVQARVDDPKPFIAGLDQVNVHLSAGAATKDLVYYVSTDRKTILRGETFRLDGNPFQPQLDLLKLEHQPSFGPEQAPLTLVVFSDFQCPMCREEAKEMRARIPAEYPKEARVVFVNYPLESIHPWARLGAIGGRCVYGQSGSAFWDYHDWIFEHQPEITVENFRSKVMEWAKGKRVDAAQLGSCIDTRGSDQEVNAEIAVGRKLQVDSTPTTFLNGRRLAGHVPWQNLSQIMKLELEFKKR